MNILQALLDEHQEFYSRFDDLERALDVEGPTGTQIAPLGRDLETHARLEDELLFGALEAHLGPSGPLAVMRMEHDEIERTLAELQATAGPAEAGPLARHLLEVTRGHFAKEEQILFPTAEQVLNEDALEELGAEWVNRRHGLMI